MSHPTPLIGYNRDGATTAHLVGSVHPPEALCGVALESIPLHQMEPEQICWRCRTKAKTTPPVMADTDPEVP